MTITLVVAMDLKNGIGRDGGLPWHLKTDLQRFKQITLGNPIVMGRKTFQSIGRALPGRENIVISSNPQFQAAGCHIVKNLEDGLQLASELTSQEIFVIGGAQVFAQVFQLAKKIHLTLVHTIADCQVFFPDLAWNAWQVVREVYNPLGEKDQFASTYYELVR